MTWTQLPAWIPASILGLLLVEGWLTRFRLLRLPRLAEDHALRRAPSICLCIPARNEATEIGLALDSWLAQDYAHLTILAVDDDSTDGTGEILAEHARWRPDRLRVLHSGVLPPGWLGKNHALHLATSQPEASAAEWLLFVDADVHATPDLLRRTMAHLESCPADLLTLIAAVDTVSPAERLFIPSALMQFLWITPPDRVADPHSAFFCGTGAFTLVRRKVYEAIGGHAEAPLDAVDDMHLAQRVKRAGFITRMAQGGPDLRLRMYRGLGEILRGMRKNILGVPGIWIFAPVMILLVLVLFLSPLWLALGGWPLAGFAVWILWPVMVGETYQRITKAPMDWIWALWPLCGAIIAAAMTWAFLDRLRGVNHWRGRAVKV